MPVLNPPVEIAEEENKEKARYLLDVATKPGFDEFTPVRVLCVWVCEALVL